MKKTSIIRELNKLIKNQDARLGDYDDLYFGVKEILDKLRGK